MHAWTRLMMDCRTISKVSGGCEWFDRQTKCVGEVSLHFQLETDTLQFLSVPTDKRVKVLRLGESGSCTSKSKCLRTYVYMNIFPCFWCGELTPEFCSSILDTPDIAYHFSLLRNKPIT
jgi:hypothetical protein